jgi:hypothetical protein
MGLVLGLTIGKDVYFNKVKVTLESVSSPTRYKVKVHGEALDQIFEVENTATTEIMPNVFVSAGPTHRPGCAKMVIEAPQSVNIKRGDVLRREMGKSARTRA